MNRKPEAWTPERRVGLVLQVLRGEGSVEQLASRHGLDPSQVEIWTRRFVEAGEAALRTGVGGLAGGGYDRIRELERKLGEMALEMDRLRKQLLNAESRIAEAQGGP